MNIKVHTFIILFLLIRFPVPNVADINHKYQPPLEKVSGELARCAPGKRIVFDKL